MLTANRRKQMRRAALVGVFLSFVLLYLGPVTLESAAVTIAGLTVAAITAVVAWLAF